MRWLAAALLLAGAGPAPAEPAGALILGNGRELPVDLRRPPDAAGPLPAVMLFGGFRSAARVLDKVHSPRPLIWASFNYPFDPPRKFRFPASLRHAPEMRAAIHDSIEGVTRLHDWLRQRPDVDPRRITVVGASAGAPFAVIGAARANIPGVILVHGFGEVTDVIAHQLARRYESRWWGRWVRGPAWLLARWIVWYCEVPRIEDHAARLRAGQTALLITAADDAFIPRHASDALWQALEQSPARRERLELPGAHLGRGDDSAQVAALLDRSLAWMEQHDLL